MRKITQSHSKYTMSKQQPSFQLPILDISQPLRLSALPSILQACHEWGFFYIANHGLSDKLLTALYYQSKQLFTLPTEYKLKLGPSSSIKSYTPRHIASPFYEGLVVSGSPDFFSSAMNSINELYVDAANSEFCCMLHDYCTKMEELSKRITSILLHCIGDEAKKRYHESEFGKCHGYLRIIHYSPPDKMESDEDYDDVEGLGIHTDMSCITIVKQDEIGGLQVKSNDGKWANIEPCEGALVVNIGDLMQAWSNGVLRSSEHRVMLKPSVSRLSLAFFWCFEDEKVVCAPEEVVGIGKERAYRPFVCADYIKFRENSEIGRFEKVGHTVNHFAAINCPDGLFH